MGTLDELVAETRAFRDARDWRKFHTPKNLAMALSAEVGELLAELQWLTNVEVESRLRDGALLDRVSDEVADVMLYLVMFADACRIDPVEVAFQKLRRNEGRYPASGVYGNAAKHEGSDRKLSDSDSDASW